MKIGLAASSLVMIIGLSGCGLWQSGESYHNPKTGDEVGAEQKRVGSLLGGDGGLDILGGSKKPNGDNTTGIGVNSFLWRASLDTLAFMPLASADPFGGVIITDWYTPPEAPDERFKLNVFILDRQLRTDSLRAAVFHQRRVAAGAWIDVAVEATTATD